MLTTAGFVALAFPLVFAFVLLGLLAMLPAKRREAMDGIVADNARPLAGATILSGLAALLVALLAYATVGDEIAVYAASELIMAGHIGGMIWIIWRESAQVCAVAEISGEG